MFVILILHVLLLFLYNIYYIFCFTGGCLAINTTIANIDIYLAVHSLNSDSC